MAPAEQIHQVYMERRQLRPAQIAAMFGISEAYMFRLFKRLGLTLRTLQRRPALSKEQVLEVYEAYCSGNGRGVRDIAGDFGLTQYRMYELFSIYGLPVKRRLRHGPEFTIERLQQIHADYMQSRSDPRDFAAQYGISSQYLYQLFNLAGLAQRRRFRTRMDVLNNGRCPCLRTALLCGWCPCPPACKEWDCEKCNGSRDGTCPCWSAELREQAGWAAAFERWQNTRTRTDKAVARAMGKAQKFEHAIECAMQAHVVSKS